MFLTKYQINLRTFNFLKKLHIENCRRENLYIQDYTAFWYENQPIEMIKFAVQSSGKSPNRYEYLCIRFENLEKVKYFGQITVKKDDNWNFRWNYDLDQKKSEN